MTTVSYSSTQLLNRFIAWAETNPDIRAVLMVGSHSRVDHPADQWSDLDLLVTFTDVQRYLHRTDWLSDLGTLWVTHLEPAPTGGATERRALFEGAVDIDFILVPHADFSRLAQTTQVAALLRRGFRALIDKDRVMSRITLPIGPRAVYHPPTQAEFLNLVHEFWYHAIWSAKKLRRGEVYTAKLCVDGHMKRLIIQMLAWHARAVSPRNYDTWFEGRFLEEWADPRALDELRDAYARYDADDVGRALLATMALFRWIAIETAQQLGYVYPYASDEPIIEWVMDTVAA